jgi:hypothetical protein
MLLALAFQRCAVSESDYLRKHALECLRLSADCMQLVGDIRSPTLQRHFLEIAKAWTREAEDGPDPDRTYASVRVKPSQD